MYNKNKTGKIARWEADVKSATKTENNQNKKCEIFFYYRHH